MDASLIIEVRDTLDDIRAAAWNALERTGNPFLRHEFLHTLETTGCLGDATGWYPRYFLLRRASKQCVGELIAAVPAYLKVNSYGEFVFDWAWASAYERHGLHYYPKLVAAIPFTPATGPRLLVRHDQPFAQCASLLIQAMRQYADSTDCSSVHWLFVTEREQALLCGPAAPSPPKGTEPTGEYAAPLARYDCQYHWYNRGYRDFAGFLATCTAKRRKTIRRERRHVADAGLTLVRRTGDSLDAEEWQSVHTLYASTYDRKWGNPSLTVEFFERMGAVFGTHTLIVFVYDPLDARSEDPVACSILFHGGGTLYGRYWGCRRHYHSLHFEACYYQGIEFCIEQGIECFEPGAQGEHKITRGFEPTLTRSAHHIAHPQFREAIREFLNDERVYVEHRCAGLADLLPFRHDELSV